MDRGEGISGLTRAIMYAGSPAAVISLWNVRGDGARQVMIRFYGNMINKALPKEKALRSAKIDLIGNREDGDKENGALRYPFFWSAFVMYGE